jgi:hypothetical protein
MPAGGARSCARSQANRGGEDRERDDEDGRLEHAAGGGRQAAREAALGVAVATRPAVVVKEGGCQLRQSQWLNTISWMVPGAQRRI